MPVLWLTPSTRPPNVLNLVSARRRGAGRGRVYAARNPYAPPAFTATYDPVLGRVRLAGADLFGGVRAEVVRFDTATLTNGQDVRGGDLELVAGGLRVDDYEFTPGVLNTYRVRVYDGADVLLGTMTATVTPVLTEVWLKNLARPYLNRVVTVHDYGDVTTPARGGVLDVLGRRLPVAVTDVRGSRSFDLVLKAEDFDELDALDLFLSFGDPIYLQTPADSQVPGPMHAFVGDVVRTKGGQHQYELRFLTLPLTETDAPAAGIVGTTVTIAGLVSAFATIADVLAAFPTVADMLEYVSAPTDEVVG